ncbi:hypothetical protein ACPA9J_35050 [Pseudomonas aeruginosa]
MEVFPPPTRTPAGCTACAGVADRTPEDKPDCLVLILHDATEWALPSSASRRPSMPTPAPAVVCRLSDYR